MTADPRRLRITAIADTDSYVKWAAALVADARVDGSLVVLETELVVSDAQLTAALAGSGLAHGRVRRARLEEIADAGRDADVVLVAARGPVVRVVARAVREELPRAAIATGLPGISVPATWRALHFRRGCDLFVLHSHREVREFAALARERGIPQDFALATLPFARGAGGSAPAGGTDLVFAAQAIVPREPEDRRRVARILLDAARADPDRRVVVKLRGRPGEHQTHRETDAYPDLVAEHGAAPANLVVSYAPMSEALQAAEGLVTVSSTAAIEAAAAGVPVIALDDFGVSPELINVVFRGSGLLAGAADVVARRFRRPRPEWLEDNYFHDPASDTWVARAEEMARARAQGVLPHRPSPAALGGRVRRAFERRLALGRADTSAAGRAAYAIGVPLRALLRAARWAGNRIRPAVRR
ncbi:DUF6716 putative glycosyltransferase [Microbacterium sp. ZXX196]|uniref:DUF6716 putative glycosyltransferase n=1 Tax=Microbacterium sp. ZXX196 TaxID=2609291 RepID=UPI0012B7E4E9|nr:hypothetical protein [Microbacterium sp. ZXX196]